MAKRSPEQRLLDWCAVHGIQLDGVKLDGRRLVATRNLAVGHCAVRVACDAVLSTEVALASEVGACILAQPQLHVVQELERTRRLWLAGGGSLEHLEGLEVITRRSVLYCYLIHQRHVAVGDARRWSAYADALPDAYSSPLTWEPSELSSELQEDVARWRQHLDSQYAALFPVLSSADPALFPAAAFTPEAWMWAHLTYETRCFPSHDGGAPANDEDEDGVLVPLVDMLNHDHGHCQLGWASGAEAVAGERRMCVRVATARGDELLYSYGAKSGARLMNYGFALFDNPSETVALPSPPLRALLARAAPSRAEAPSARLASLSEALRPVGTPWRRRPWMRRLRRRLMAALQAEEEEGGPRGGLELSHATPLPGALLGLARAACMTRREALALRPTLARSLCRRECAGLSAATERRARRSVGAVLASAWEAQAAQVSDLTGLPMGRDADGAGARGFERLVRRARRNALAVGGGEYATRPLDCQLACADSRFLVLMGAMEALQAMGPA